MKENLLELDGGSEKGVNSRVNPTIIEPEVLFQENEDIQHEVIYETKLGIPSGRSGQGKVNESFSSRKFFAG